MKYINDKIAGIKPSGIRKFFNLANEIPGVVSLGVGEPDFVTPKHICDAATRALEEGKTAYTANAGLPALREAISDHKFKKMGIRYDAAKEILVTAGCSEAIDVVLRALLTPGDEVIYAEPGYVAYLACITMADGVPVPIPVKEENGFVLTGEELEAAITDKTRVLLLSYPNNPTGGVASKEELQVMADIAIKHDLVVISDEIYGDLTYGVENVSIATLPGMRERTIVIDGFSKAYAMTGWRLGYAMGPAEMMEQIMKIHQYVLTCAPSISQYAGIEALKNGDDDVAMMRDAYNERREFLMAAFKDMGLPCYEPKGAFYVFPNISKFGMTSDDFAMKLLEAEKVAVVPGTAFGDSGEGFIRISYAYSMDQLRTAMEKLKNFISTL